MERTQIYLDSEQKEKLLSLADETGRTMAELIREAVQQYIVKIEAEKIDTINDLAGLWKDRDDIDDSCEYVNELRNKWNNRLEEIK